MSEEQLLTFYDANPYFGKSNLYFQFDDDEPFLMQENVRGEFTVTIIPGETEQSLEFVQNEKRFRIFMKPNKQPS